MRYRCQQIARPRGSIHFGAVSTNQRKLGDAICDVVESLEPRWLLSASTAIPKLKAIGFTSPINIRFRANLHSKHSNSSKVATNTTGQTTPYGGLTPAQIRGAYGVPSITFNGTVGDGSGETIAILDPGDDTGMVNSTSPSFSSSDLAMFDSYYGLPSPPSFTKMGFTDPSSGIPALTTTLPAAGSADDEISLDVEWAHAIAPGANILLVEGAPDFSDIFNGVLAIDAAAASMHIVALSMSFGGAENGELSSTADAEAVDGYYFDTAGLVYLASSGDYGAYEPGTSTVTSQFPASSSNVVAVGGTTLSVSGNSWSSESTWGNGTSSGNETGGGGGFSVYEPQPSYQVGKVNGLTTTKRSYPDISLEANPTPGVPIYDSPDYGTGTGWVPGTIGGTSLSSPLMSGLVAIADQGRTSNELSPLNSSGGSGVAASNPNGNAGSLDIHKLLYNAAKSDFHDITTGSSIGQSNYGPKTGYDLSSGIGTPIANNLVEDLAGKAPAITTQPSSQTITVGNSVTFIAAATGTPTPTAQWEDSTNGGTSYTAISGATSTTYTFATTFSQNDYLYKAVFTNDQGSTATNAATLTVDPTWLSTTSIATWNATTHTLTVTGAASIIADPGTDEPIINASGAAAVLTLDPTSGTDIHIGGLSLTNGASAVVTSLGAARTTSNYHLLVVGTPGAAVAPTYTIDSTSTLDLADNDMAILYGSGASPLTTVNAQLQAAYDADKWDEPGLTSSVAKTMAGVTALGVGEASTLGLTTFDGLTLGGNAVLVKYTLAGDAFLQGAVSLNDYNLVLANYNATGATWSNGSFDYSGSVGLTDYDDAINNYDQTLANVLT
jgi:subtilase family serine protease